MGVRRAPLLLAVTLVLATAAAGPAAADPGLWPWGELVAAPRIALETDRATVGGPAEGAPRVAMAAGRAGVAGRVPVSVRVPVSGRVPSPRPVPGAGRVRPPRPVPRVSVRRPAPPQRVTVGPTVKVPRVSTRRSPDPEVSISMPRAKRRAAPEVTVPQVTVFPDGVCAGGVVLGDCPRDRPRPVPRVVAPPVVPVRVLPSPSPSPSPTPVVTPTPSSRPRVQRAEPPGRRRNPLNSVMLTVVLVTAITSTTAVAFRARR
ncbi:hypothetical protein [Nonomuraea gerenzanensis]|uniref:Basic proline-rich protein n=1 Tax=Nonomuraea gerenzanensis TaxID=93944 RepID=A0A1M4E962_9ACTN|nr:hypothetical protein [Nonomuraea gerenzanensis]UBU17608.1 hypothetical protein LCN96_22045 [Nonomuraea gerenzanensis]SBO95375.1 Basic proline-rich protein precursor [Nonomuraea gerenzanensis]